MLKHFLSSLSTNAIIMIASLLQGIIIARTLHTEGKGEIAVYITIYSLVYSFSNLGIRQSSSYYYSKENVPAPDILNVQFYSIFIASIISSLLMIIIFLMQGLINYNILFYFILTIPFALYTTYTTSFALSNRWINKLNIIKITLALVSILFIIIFYYLLELQDIKYYFISLLIANICTAYYVSTWVKDIDNYGYSLNKINAIYKNSKKILRKGLMYALPLFVYGINYKIDILILNNMVNKSDIGIYSVGVTFAELIWQIPMILSMIIFSYSVSEKDSKKFSILIWDKNKKIMLSMIPLLFIYGYIIQYLIPQLFGLEFNLSSDITYLLLPGTFAIVSFNILNADLAARGFPHVALKIFIIAGLCNIILNYILIPKYGINGAAIASSLSYIFASLYYTIKYYNITFKEENI